MKRAHSTHGKILRHDAGLGAVTPEDIRVRAKELARINGRNPEEFTQTDWERAKQELQGGHNNGAEDTPDEMVTAVTDWEEVPGSHGHRVEKRGPDDTENIGIELISEGMEEAVHEQMLEASRIEEIEEEEDIDRS